MAENEKTDGKPKEQVRKGTPDNLEALVERSKSKSKMSPMGRQQVLINEQMQIRMEFDLHSTAVSVELAKGDVEGAEKILNRMTALFDRMKQIRIELMELIQDVEEMMRRAALPQDGRVIRPFGG